MADEIIGSLGVEITGESSGLKDAIDSAAAAAERGASVIAEAFQSAQQALDPGQFQIFKSVIEAEERPRGPLIQSFPPLSPTT